MIDAADMVEVTTPSVDAFGWFVPAGALGTVLTVEDEPLPDGEYLATVRLEDGREIEISTADFRVVG